MVFLILFTCAFDSILLLFLQGYQLPGKPLGKPKVLRHKLPDEYASPVKPVKPETKRESKKTGREDKIRGVISPPTHDHLDYDIPRPSSLRLVLLEFIDEEYSAMSDMIKVGNREREGGRERKEGRERKDRLERV